MVDLLFTYLNIGLMGSIMILAVLLARPLLCKTPRNISCVLWMLVALRLLLPFQLESPLSLQPSQLTECPATVEHTPESPVTKQKPITNVTSTTSTVSVISEDTHSSHIQPETVISALWMCGGVTVLLYASISYGVLRFRIRDAIKSSDNTWESKRISGAFLLGYFRPRICIPTGLSLQDRGFIIAHENAHLKRGDHWWKLLGMVCLSIHWYNPLVWLSYALWCRDIEVACDERVIHSMELEERKSYSFALLNCSKRLSGFLTYPVAFGEISIKTRIRGVLTYHKPRFRSTAAALILTTLVAICFMTNPSATATATSPKPEQHAPAVETIDTPNIETVSPTETEKEFEKEPICSIEPTIKTDTAPTVPTEPTTEIPASSIVPTKTKPKQPDATQTTVTEPTTEELFIPSVTIPENIDFSTADRVDSVPQFPSYDPPIPDKEENQNIYGDTGGISLIPKEPVKTGVELPSVIIWEDISPKPGYPAFP